MKNNRPLLKDFSAYILLLSNLITAYFIFREGWSVGTVLWIYWSQSVAIGFFNVFKILSAKDYSPPVFLGKINVPRIFSGRGILEKMAKASSLERKTSEATFFALHYGFLNLVLFSFLAIFSFSPRSLGEINFNEVLFGAGIFFVNHGFSFFYNRDIDGKKSVDELMIAPYPRIIPMNLAIIVFVFLPGERWILPGFLLLKTLIDIVSHSREHRLKLAAIYTERSRSRRRRG